MWMSGCLCDKRKKKKILDDVESVELNSIDAAFKVHRYIDEKGNARTDLSNYRNTNNCNR